MARVELDVHREVRMGTRCLIIRFGPATSLTQGEEPHGS